MSCISDNILVISPTSRRRLPRVADLDALRLVAHRGSPNVGQRGSDGDHHFSFHADASRVFSYCFQLEYLIDLVHVKL